VNEPYRLGSEDVDLPGFCALDDTLCCLLADVKQSGENGVATRTVDPHSVCGEALCGHAGLDFERRVIRSAEEPAGR